jgi:Fe-S cluster assembly protein SufB
MPEANEPIPQPENAQPAAAGPAAPQETAAAPTTNVKPPAGLPQAYQYGFHETEKHTFRTKVGLSREVVEEISAQKNEPQWMRDFRLRALDIFLQKPMPSWGGDLSKIDFAGITYYLKPSEKQYDTWDMVPEEIKHTYEKLGIPEDERKFLGGVGAQYDSEVVYHNLKSQWEKKGVLFISPEEAIQQHPDLVKEYFGTIIPPADNKFAALNSAVWSGGSFIYVPKGVRVDIPLQAYFRINAKNMGQFERTLIIVDEGAFVHYVEGCTAPVYSSDSLHSAVVEIIVKRGARCRYTTIQNWSTNVYNLVTKRAVAYADATMEWVDGNIGSKMTMKYPAVYMLEPGARGEILSIAFAGKGQHQDAGAKVVHCAPNTSSTITSKSISKDGGRASYRGLCKVRPGADNSKSRVICDALILDEKSRSDTYPQIEVGAEKVSVEHEASVSKISEEQLFYLMSRGLSEDEAAKMIITGFIEPLVKALPMEYAVEMNRLIELELEGSVG